jgi:cytochrome P450 family 142 subfamily A polypeptide 1
MEAAATAYVAFDAYARDMIAERRREPTDDLVSVFVHAEVDGDHLDDGEIVYETLLLLVGGDESTRHVISGGIEALLRHPDERHRIVHDPALLPGAVEEMLRWVSPVKNMTRTVTRDTVLEGQELPAGAKLLLLYESADYDDAQFDEPTRFDVTRTPNDHLAFGFGAHFCLGASLARLEIQTMVGRVLSRLPDMQLADQAADPDALPRHLGALTSLPVTFDA